jgi:hypothetical protein
MIFTVLELYFKTRDWIWDAIDNVNPTWYDKLHVYRNECKMIPSIGLV